MQRMPKMGWKIGLRIAPDGEKVYQMKIATEASGNDACECVAEEGLKFTNSLHTALSS